MKVAADANVVLAALAKGAAGRILESPEVEVFTVRSVIEEVEEYLPYIAKLKKIDEALLQMTLVHLPLTIVEPERYEEKKKEAADRISKRDPDDVDLLALALAWGIPVWSNDNDFEGTGIEWYTTAQLLKKLAKK